MKVTELKFLNLNAKNTSIEKAATSDQSIKEDKKLKDASKQLEGQFLTFMLKAMEKTIHKNDSEDSPNIANMMFSSVMGREMAESGGIGLADFFYKALKENGSEALKNFKNSPLIDPEILKTTLKGIEND